MQISLISNFNTRPLKYSKWKQPALLPPTLFFFFPLPVFAKPLHSRNTKARICFHCNFDVWTCCSAKYIYILLSRVRELKENNNNTRIHTLLPKYHQPWVPLPRNSSSVRRTELKERFLGFLLSQINLYALLYYVELEKKQSKNFS